MNFFMWTFSPFTCTISAFKGKLLKNRNNFFICLKDGSLSVFANLVVPPSLSSNFFEKDLLVILKTVRF
jgi:hypothetical protein